MTEFEIRTAAIEALCLGRKVDSPQPADVSDETPLAAGGLGISSVTFLHAFVALEERFGLSFDDSEVFNAKFHTVGDFVRFLGASFGKRETLAREH
ncbi:acyl carrier protein [Variovorax sp. ZS18.2.2]|uniref:acyl carrier protein n=1 Tax=Variovorax sp. ZS18.2.2 TaxID=2971255 RepID=UPI00215143AD|nr:acyl carrier protein [Variovorax sp. ZS18.2.2]MCR6480884.1 acyl carrier protein [Variovorax sp. ZS18.2.2]